MLSSGFICDSGFWEAYDVVRVFMHGVLRRELTKEPAPVLFTGHSLGGGKLFQFALCLH